MKTPIKTSMLLLVLGFLITPFQSFAAAVRPIPYNLQTINRAEAILAIARGPLAALSYRNQGKHTKTAKALHVATDAVRLANEVLTIINHPGDPHFSSCFWAVFDASNLYIDIMDNDKKVDDIFELSEIQQKKINHLSQITQTYLLPLTESATALYQAVNTNQSLKNSIYRQRAQAFESLARATSVYLNHQKSRAAIVLLVGAIAQIVHALSLEIPPTPPQQENNNQPNAVQLGHFEQVNQFRRDDAANRILFAQTAQNPPVIRLEPRMNQDSHELVDNLIIERNGQELALHQDAITMGDWEAGDRVRIFACNHATLEDNIAPMEQAEVEQQEILVLDLGYIRHTCHLCQRIRVPHLERVMVIP
ncbi:hypothetical protein JST56_06580 [Candidatus Dependentiae bacterium]|nr:hypothetical protein [Candidatus Dependentiae bacterium]